jgi:chromate transporter
MERQVSDRLSMLRGIFVAFLRMGLTSFGGPIAHLGYFREEFVVRRRWITERGFVDLVALCQFLPGPASSQVGFGIGLLRGGVAGGMMAWLGFTLPSAVLMLLLGYGADDLASSADGAGLLHGLKLMAVAIIAQALVGMVRTLCPDRTRSSIAVLSVLLLLALHGALGQIAAILLGGLAGLFFCRDQTDLAPEPLGINVSRRVGVCCIGLSVALLVLSLLPSGNSLIGLFDAFYRSGALVFGGGHVVLPLLHDAVVEHGWVSASQFLAGYGAAQALPGPLFAFSAYLGSVARVGPGGIEGGCIALIAIFLPGLLILVGVLPFWAKLRNATAAQATIRGINAAVVGVLASAFFDPVWTSAVLRPADFAVALTGFALLVAWRTPPLLVALLSAAAGVALR